LSGVRDLAVAEGAWVLFGWQRNISESDLAMLLDDWAARLLNNVDYGALIDWLNLWQPHDAPIADSVKDRVWRMLLRRRDFEDIGQGRWDWGQLANRFVDEKPIELAGLVLDLIESDAVMIHSSDDEARLLVEAAKKRPADVWSGVVSRLEAGSWRLSMAIRGWLTNTIPADIIETWVGDDLERARLVASIVSLGASEPSPVARFLLANFDDDDISSSLYAQFISGFWTGPQSAHLERQIKMLQGWREQTAEPLGVRTWARKMIENLEVQRAQAMQWEEERGF
jgi:hypothetical protein